jgi:hypothetical protein
MRKSNNPPKQHLLVRSYDLLDEIIQGFAQGHLGLLILTGPPGVGKSHAVKAALGPAACVIEGNATAYGVYTRLYEAVDLPVLIDDIDSLERNRDMVRLLKCVCQSSPIKTVRWNSDPRTLAQRGVPDQFETSSRVAIIANDWKQSNKDVLALEDRGHLVQFAPNAAEVHRKVATWFWDQEVFDFFGERLQLIHRPSFRHYSAAVELKTAGLSWKDFALGRLLTGKLLAIAQLKASSRYQTEEERVQAFIDAGHGCRATYFNLAKKLPPPMELSSLRVRGTSPEAQKSPMDILELLKRRQRGLGNG